MSTKINYPINVRWFFIPGTNQKFYTPQSDIVFRAIFSKPGNEHITKALIESLLNKKIPQINLQTNPQFLVENVNDKQQIVDVKVLCPNNKYTINLEMQFNAEEDDPKRFGSYAEKIHIADLSKGKSYKDLKDVIQIIIASGSYPQFEKNVNYHTIWQNRDLNNTGLLFNSNITTHLFELKKYIKQKNRALQSNKKFKINEWIEFFINPLGKEVQEAMRTQAELREAVDNLKRLNMDEEVRQIAEMEMFWEWDAQARKLDEEREREEIIKKAKIREKRAIKRGLKERKRKRNERTEWKNGMEKRNGKWKSNRIKTNNK